MTEWFGPKAAAASEQEGKSYRVLIVDDDVEVLRSLTYTLRRATRLKTQITSEPSPQRGVELLGEHGYDLIVSDYRMPGMNGVELLRTARKLQPECRRILITGYFEEEIAHEAVNDAKVHGYLFKPWSTAHLGEHVRGVLLSERPRELELSEALQLLENAQGVA